MFTGGPQAAKLVRLLFHLPNFVRLARRLWEDPRVPIHRKALPLLFAVLSAVVGLGYLVRPVDLVFDYLPIVGRLDDLAVLAFLLVAPGVCLMSCASTWRRSTAAARRPVRSAGGAGRRRDRPCVPVCTVKNFGYASRRNYNSVGLRQ